MARDIARRLVRRLSGPLATTYCCPFCTFHLRFKKGLRGVGRGYGLEMGGALQSQVAAHIRKEHPRELLEAQAEDRVTPRYRGFNYASRECAAPAHLAADLAREAGRG